MRAVQLQRAGQPPGGEAVDEPVNRSAAPRGSGWSGRSPAIASATSETHASVASRTWSRNSGWNTADAWISPHTTEVRRADSSSSASSVLRTPPGAVIAARSLVWSRVAPTSPLREPK